MVFGQFLKKYNNCQKSFKRIKIQKALPALDKKIIKNIFSHVYDIVGIKEQNNTEEKDEKFSGLLKTLMLKQKFNYKSRQNDLREVFSVASEVIDFEINSEGTSLWLALMLAIKELYNLSDIGLVKILKKINFTK